jgi:hypothetical protein
MDGMNPRTKFVALGIFVGAWLAMYAAFGVVWLSAPKPLHPRTPTSTCGIRGWPAWSPA